MRLEELVDCLLFNLSLYNLLFHRSEASTAVDIMRSVHPREDHGNRFEWVSVTLLFLSKASPPEYLPKHSVANEFLLAVPVDASKLSDLKYLTLVETA